MKARIKDFDSYLALQPERVKAKLVSLHQAIKTAAPEAEEVISYSMPAFKYHGMLVWIGAHTNHVGLYPRASGIEAFKKELSVYKFAKGSVQFPLDKPLPLKLITKIVKFRVKENLSKLKK